MRWAAPCAPGERLQMLPPGPAGSKRIARWGVADEHGMHRPAPPPKPLPLCTPPVQLLAAAGMDKVALEEQLAAREEEHLLAEFRRSLELNMGKVGALKARQNPSLALGDPPGSEGSSRYLGRSAACSRLPRSPPFRAFSSLEEEVLCRRASPASIPRPSPPPACPSADRHHAAPPEPPHPPTQAARGWMEPARHAPGQGSARGWAAGVCCAARRHAAGADPG